MSGLYERIACAAQGLLGGRPGATGAIEASAGSLRSKIRTTLPAGAVVTLELPGGGGYGPPFKRDPERVLRDVQNGYVSIESAERDYGVAIDPDRLEILEEKTRARRAEMEKTT